MIVCNKNLVKGKWLNVLNVIEQLKYLHLNGMGKAYEAIGYNSKGKTS